MNVTIYECYNSVIPTVATVFSLETFGGSCVWWKEKIPDGIVKISDWASGGPHMWHGEDLHFR